MKKTTSRDYLIGLLSSGAIFFHIAQIPWDLPSLGLAAFLSMVVWIKKRKMSKLHFREVLLQVGFFLAIFAFTGYSVESLFIFSLILLGIVVPKSTEFFAGFCAGVVALAVFAAVQVLLHIEIGVRASAFGVNPVWMAWLLGAGVIIATTLSPKKIFVPAAVILAIALFYNGSRAPLGATLVSVLIIHLKDISLPKILGLTMALPIISILLPASRFENIEGAFEDAARLDLWSTAATQIAERPLGYGYGKFYLGIWDYPHNLLLEFTHIHGVVFALIFVVLFVVRPLFRAKGRRELLVFSLLLFSFTVAMFSGALVSHRLFYFLIGYSLTMNLKFGSFENPGELNSRPNLDSLPIT